MLILTRKAGESIMIDDEVEVRILGVRGQQVRLGIYADKQIAVHRKEIYERIAAQKEQEGEAL